jgi:hypothetical protein
MCSSVAGNCGNGEAGIFRQAFFVACSRRFCGPDIPRFDTLQMPLYLPLTTVREGAASFKNRRFRYGLVER